MSNNVIVDRNEIIDEQLNLPEVREKTFDDSHSTTLRPARFIPKPDNSESLLCLNGEWRAARWPFECDEQTLCSPDTGDVLWEKVQQPGKVFYYDPEENPANVENWNRVKLTHIDPEDGAVIRRTVQIPEDWEGTRVFLHLDAIYPGGRIYCNGEHVADHFSGLTPIQRDVTDFVEPGRDAVIAVRLYRKYEYVKMDMPRHALEFTGLNQDAFLFSVCETYIPDYRLSCSLDSDLTTGRVQGHVQVRNMTSESDPAAVTVEVIDPETSTFIVGQTKDVQPESWGDDYAEFSLTVNNPRLWNDEYPNLYNVRITLHCAGQELEATTFRSGFRRFEVKDQRPLLNGRPVKFRGVNQLTYHPEYGMHTPKEWLRRSLELMKKANVNAIRTHFTGPPALSELCDEMGFYLLQELPIDWGHDYLHDPGSVGPALYRLEGSVRRDIQHPSVMVWSIGNENMPRNMDEYPDFMNHLQLFDEFVKRLDPERYTMFPPPGPANKIKGIFETRLGDIGDIHYSFELVKEFNRTGQFSSPETWERDMVTFTREEALQNENGWKGIWFSSEYGITNFQPDLLNAPYASLIADVMENPLSGKNTLQIFSDRLAREWGFMREDPTCLGGAYFPWLCAGAGDNPWGWVRWGEDADWGVVTADLLPKPAFWAMRVNFSPIQFPDRMDWKEGQESIEFDLYNGYNSIDLKDCTLRTQMGGGGKSMGNMRTWKDIPVSCPPGETCRVSIPIWNSKSLGALEKGLPVVCRCILLEPQGFRPITADIKLVPEELAEDHSAMPVGPDAE